MSEDGTAGVAVTASGDLVSVYKVPGSKVDVNPLLAEAAKVATTLDNFDIGGKLPSVYGPHGFRPAARMKFNRDFAPEGWDYAVYGEPDVVFMVKDVEGKSGLPDASTSYDPNSVPLVETWDEAVALRDAALGRLKEAKPDSGLTETLYQLKATLGKLGMTKLNLAVASHTNLARLNTTQDALQFITQIDQATQKLIDSNIGAVQTLQEVASEAAARRRRPRLRVAHGQGAGGGQRLPPAGGRQIRHLPPDRAHPPGA